MSGLNVEKGSTSERFTEDERITLRGACDCCGLGLAGVFTTCTTVVGVQPVPRQRIRTSREARAGAKSERLSLVMA